MEKENIMKNIINFCEANNYAYVIETLRNGLKRAKIETKDYPSAKEIKDKARGNKKFYADTWSAIGIVRAKAYIYNADEWEKAENKRMGLVTVAEMQAITNKLISLGYGNYSVVARVPLDGSALMYPSWDSFAGTPSFFDNENKKIFLDLEEYSCQVKVPKKLIEWVENSSPNTEGCKNVSNSNVNSLDEILLSLIDSGFESSFVCRTSFKAGEDKYDKFGLGQVARVNTKENLIFLSMQKV